MHPLNKYSFFCGVANSRIPRSETDADYKNIIHLLHAAHPV